MSKEFEQRYLGRWQEDPIMKALKKGYMAAADKDSTLFIPQSIINNGIEAIKHGSESEKVLVAVLESLAAFGKEMHRLAMDASMLETKPIIMCDCHATHAVAKGQE